MDKHITVPMKKETVATLKAGDYVYLTGTVYTVFPTRSNGRKT